MPHTHAAARTPREHGAAKPELAEVFRKFGDAYAATHPVPPAHWKVIRAIVSCRTAALGGHVEYCSACGFTRAAYNSCRNRHCPKCQALAKARWLEARRAELLAVPYFHMVFTLPHELNALALSNKKAVFELLFAAVADTLLAFGADPQHHLGGQLGFTAILHTWDQRLNQHIHLHCVVPAGALARDGQAWVHARSGFLFPVKALSRVFRGKFIEGLRQQFNSGALLFPGRTAALKTTQGFAPLLRTLWSKDWVVYSKPSFGGPAQVLDYLSRYTHRVAISNNRLLRVDHGPVCFAYRDRRDGNRLKELALQPLEFIRRFLLHVLPHSFKRIRHFGFLASRHKRSCLARCRALLHQREPQQSPPQQSVRDDMLKLTGVDIAHCPSCTRGLLVPIATLRPQRPSFLFAAPPKRQDSS